MAESTLNVPDTVIGANGHICEPPLLRTNCSREKFRGRVLRIVTANVSGLPIEDDTRLGKPGTGAGPFPAPGLYERCS